MEQNQGLLSNVKHAHARLLHAQAQLHWQMCVVCPTQEYSDLKTQSWVQADRDGEGSPTESGMSMDSIPMRKRSRKPKHVYNAADVAPLQAPWKAYTFKPKKVCHLPAQMVCRPRGCHI